MANIKITQLPTATTIGDNDLIPVVTGIGGTPVTEHITKYDFAATIATSPVETNPVENTYSDIATMLADQSNQTTNYFNYVIDASADPNVVAGAAYYEKLTASTTTLSTDYRLLSDTEVEIIRDSNSYRVFKIQDIQDDGTPLTSVNGGRISFEYSGTDVTAILFNKLYTDGIAEFYGKDVSVRFYNRTTRKYETEAVASTAWTTVNTDYYRAAVTGTNIQIADLTVNNRVEFFIVEAASGGGVSQAVSKTGTNIVFTENALYNESTYLTTGALTLSLTGAVKDTHVLVYCDRYIPVISGELYLKSGTLETASLNELWFYWNGTSISLNVINRDYLSAPLALLVTPSNAQNTISGYDDVNADSYEILFSTTNDINTASAVPSYNGTDTSYVHTGLTNGTTYYYWVKVIGNGYLDSEYHNESAIPIITNVPTSNLIGFYNLNESSGTTLVDAHSSANNGALTNVTLSTTGKINNAHTYNGTSSFATLSALNNSFNNTDWSVSLWFKSTDSSFRLFQNRSTGAKGTKVGFNIGADGGVTWGNCLIEDNAGNYIDFTAVPFNENDDLWHHLAVTFNNTTGTGKMYLDNVLVDTQTNANLIGKNFTSETLLLGKSNANSQFYSGVLDALGVWQKELTIGEISTLWNSGNGIEY